ncbi:hypothetical protein QN372_00895 [Undibacterium sp. RTI2.1]|uniref:hypothetical protein n=1 Tax=unclassified Undibacterium TaxID=2630295 RepID=UPI002AB4B4F3|nr:MULTISPECIES: hypothetical protein [unclassified Undibacterium]MDY7537694.1 hypothetical protein [Undibacterium sp. 5I1]MEB0029296.1 hypothetical protein [Undibacterium sp. RTI2.1]MEB0115604.1 hypothetical protein [Undibacterium sp. RTI2.2]MEB0256431.1 hypothetical protein [Undibacterium sp. 5I1]
MTNKHYNWHHAWHQIGNRRVHDSGLAFEFDDDLGWVTCDDTFEAWQAFEFARGVPQHDLLARSMRLAREAAEWVAS